MLTDDRFARRAQRTVRRLAGRLGSPRDEAFMSFAAAGYALIAGKRPTGDGVAHHHEPRINRVAMSRAESAFDHGDLDTALERAQELVAAHPDSIRVLRLLRDIQSRQGELSAQARTLHRIQALDESPESLRSERMLMGRIVETSAGWLPRIPWPCRSVAPTDGVVLNLLKESLPYLTNGFTMRSRYKLLAVRDAGMEPHIVTNLGFPRLLGAAAPTQIPAAEMVAGIPHPRLPLAPPP